MPERPALYELTEHTPKRIPRGSIDPELVGELEKRYGVEKSLEAAEQPGHDSWVLTPGAIVGVVTLSDGTTVRFQPKTRVSNIFEMWSRAKGDQMNLDWRSEAGVDSVDEMYDRLASKFLDQVRRRVSIGLYRSYEGRKEHTAAVRGRIDAARAISRPWDIHLPCTYQEHEADNRFNQLLLFAVFTIVRSAAIVHETTRRNASSLFRLLSGSVSLHHYRGADYGGLRYTRLNQSYQPLHAMARLFVEHAAPALPGAAKSRSVPFWIYMPRLFEEFVAAWLQRNLPSSYSLRVQHRIALPTEERGARGAYRLIPDLVIYRRVEGNKPVAVLDTKYKVVERASDADIHQIYTYASEIGVHEAWIVYPSQPALPLDQTFQRGIRICSAVFDIGGDLDRAGRDFLEQIGIGQ